MPTIKITNNEFIDIPMESELTYEQLKREVIAKLGLFWNYDLNMIDITKAILDRIDEEEFPTIKLNAKDDYDFQDEVRDIILDSMNDELIYTVDQWNVMAFYQMPKDANLDEALFSLLYDILHLVINTIEELF